MYFYPNYGIKFISTGYKSVMNGEDIENTKEYVVCLDGTDVHKELFFSDNLEDATYVLQYLQNKLNAKREKEGNGATPKAKP